jgi:hypothetical protein
MDVDTQVIFNHDNKFDVQLGAAIVHENELARLLSDKTLKVEVKTESYIWRKTGNIAIEYRNRGKKSGISVTEADIWVHELCHDDGRVVFRLVFEVPVLKKLCRAAYARGRICRNCGDDGLSDVILLSLTDLIKAATP